MNIFFNEVQKSNGIFQINPAFLVVDEISYNSDDNMVLIIGREITYEAAMTRDQYARLIDNIKQAGEKIDIRDCALFVCNDSLCFDELFEYSKKQSSLLP